jgi:hypothetical protein
VGGGVVQSIATEHGGATQIGVLGAAGVYASVGHRLICARTLTRPSSRCSQFFNKARRLSLKEEEPNIKGPEIAKRIAVTTGA